MYSLITGGSVLQYSTVAVNEKCPMYASEDLEAHSIFADWESNKLFVCFNTGVIAIYNMKEAKPIVCIRAAMTRTEGIITEFDYITWDGSYLIFADHKKVSLMDFL